MVKSKSKTIKKKPIGKVSKALKVSNEELIKEIAGKLFNLLDVKAPLNVVFNKENDVYLLDIGAQDEAGLLIGKRGETINSIQLLINQIVRQKRGEWLRVVVNVADFREKEESRMVELAQQTAERVKETGESQNLYNLTPSQRRIVHTTLSEDKKLHTESVGEGINRYLVVSLK